MIKKKLMGFGKVLIFMQVDARTYALNSKELIKNYIKVRYVYKRR